MCPDTGIIDIISISPVLAAYAKFDSLSQEAVVLLEVVDLHQPASEELTLQPGVLPNMTNIRKQILVTFLKYFSCS